MKKKSKPPIQLILAALLTVVGIVLMIGKIVVDSEPGFIPMLLIVAGSALFVITRSGSSTNNM